MKIPIILGSAREGRQSEKVANYIFQEVVKAGIKSEIIDVRDYPIGATDNSQKFGSKIEKADGIIIVSPEYNHSFPGELKMLIDLVYKQYQRKPVGICGVSGGPLGGSRMAEQLRQVCVELQTVPIREALYFPMVQNLFDDSGKIKNEVEYAPRVKAFLDELVWYAEALKKAR